MTTSKEINDFNVRLNQALERFYQLKSIETQEILETNLTQQNTNNNVSKLNNIQVFIQEKMLQNNHDFKLNSPPNFKTNPHEATEFLYLLESYTDFIANPHQTSSIDELAKDQKFNLIKYFVNINAGREHDISDLTVRPHPLKVIIAKTLKPYIKANLEQQFAILMDVAFGLWKLSEYLQHADRNQSFYQLVTRESFSTKKSAQICEDAVREILFLAGINPQNIVFGEFFKELDSIKNYNKLRYNFVSHIEPEDSYESLEQELEQLNVNPEFSYFKTARVKYLTNIVERYKILKLINKAIVSADSENKREINVKKYKDLSVMFKIDNLSDYSQFVDRLLYGMIDKCFNRDDVKELIEENPRFFTFKKACENLQQSARTQMFTVQAIGFLRKKIIDDYVDIESDDLRMSATGKFITNKVKDSADNMFKKILLERDDVEIAHLAIASAQLAMYNPLIIPNPNKLVPEVKFSPNVYKRKIKKKEGQESIQKSQKDRFKCEYKLELFQQQMQMADMILELFEQPLCKVSGHSCSVSAWAELPVGNKSLAYRLKHLQGAMDDIKMKLAEDVVDDISSFNLTKMNESEYQYKITEKLSTIEKRDVVVLHAALNDAATYLVNNVYADSPMVVAQIMTAALQTQTLIESRYNLEDFIKSLCLDESAETSSHGESYWGILKCKLNSLCLDGMFLHANIDFDFNSERSLAENLKSILKLSNDLVSDSLKSLKRMVEISQYTENFAVFDCEQLSVVKKTLIEHVLNKHPVNKIIC
jgi:hypothetical protein